MTAATGDAEKRTRETAFALLLVSQRPVAPDELASASGVRDVDSILAQLHGAGLVDRDTNGFVIGSEGLTLADAPHSLDIAGTRFQTWCAYDAFGISAALGADATVTTACGVCAREIMVTVSRGQPDRDGPERLWLATGEGDMRAAFCAPTVLLCAEHGEAWAERHRRAGTLIDLAAAAAHGAQAWRRCADAARRLASANQTDPN